MNDLVDPTLSDDPAAARKLVDENQADAVIVIPAGFTDSIIPAQGQTSPAAVVAIEVYTNPTTPTSAGVIKTIVDGFLSQVEVGRVGGEVAVTQLLQSGRIRMQDVQAAGLAAGTTTAGAAAQSTAIVLNNVTAGGAAVPFDVLALLAPGMALMFLMYTVSYGGRTLLTERNQGTLPRLLVSPTGSAQILGGKMIGIYLTGAAQMFILILGTTLLFQLQWGDRAGRGRPGAGGGLRRGRLGNAHHRPGENPRPGDTIGSAVMLTFGILGGTFINTDQMPAWFQAVIQNHAERLGHRAGSPRWRWAAGCRIF